MSETGARDKSDDTGSSILANPRLAQLKVLVVISFLALAALITQPAEGSRQGFDLAGSVQQEAKTAQASQAAIRFDNKVRESFFSGFAGDAAALGQAMKMCEEALAKDPRNADAMVWHGSGLVFQSGQAFRKRDFEQGRDLWQRGLKEMDDAVSLEPASLEVLIPRGATLLNSSRYAPQPDEARALLRKGLDDYEAVLKMQTPYFTQLPLHSRGELLFGLAEGWYRMGDTSKAKSYFNRTVIDAAGSGRDKQAGDFLKTGALPKNTSCFGCHK